MFAPVFLLLITGTVELGRAAYEAMQVSNAVSAGMLYVTKTGAFDATAIATAVVNASNVYPASVAATPAPTQFCGCPTAAGITEVLCVPPTPCDDGSTAGQYARINATLPHLTIILPNSGLLAVPDTFTAKAIIRIQ
jgi:hypothetical protein